MQFWLVFGMFLCFGMCLFGMMVHLTPYATDLEIEAGAAAGLISALGAASIVAKLVFGWLGDRLGYRNIYLICFCLFTLAMLWLLITSGETGLFIFAVVFGFSYGGCALGQSPIIADLFGVKAHGAILGTVNNGMTIGAALGPFLAGLSYDLTFSYRTAFLIMLIFSITGLLLTLLLRPLSK